MLLYFLQSTAQHHNHYFILRLQRFGFYPFSFSLSQLPPSSVSTFFTFFFSFAILQHFSFLSSLENSSSFLSKATNAIYKLVHVEIIDSKRAKVAFFMQVHETVTKQRRPYVCIDLRSTYTCTIDSTYNMSVCTYLSQHNRLNKISQMHPLKEKMSEKEKMRITKILH